MQSLVWRARRAGGCQGDGGGKLNGISLSLILSGRNQVRPPTATAPPAPSPPALPATLPQAVWACLGPAGICVCCTTQLVQRRRPSAAAGWWSRRRSHARRAGRSPSSLTNDTHAGRVSPAGRLQTDHHPAPPGTACHGAAWRRAAMWARHPASSLPRQPAAPPPDLPADPQRHSSQPKGDQPAAPAAAVSHKRSAAAADLDDVQDSGPADQVRAGGGGGPAEHAGHPCLQGPGEKATGVQPSPGGPLSWWLGSCGPSMRQRQPGADSVTSPAVLCLPGPQRAAQWCPQRLPAPRVAVPACYP